MRTEPGDQERADHTCSDQRIGDDPGRLGAERAVLGARERGLRSEQRVDIL